MFERGKELERGLCPLSLLLSSSAKKILTLFKCTRLERGYRGEVRTDNHKQTVPQK